MEKLIAEWISVFFISSLKLALGGFPLSVYYHFGFIAMFTATLSGAVAGSIFFTFLGEYTWHYLHKKFAIQKHHSHKYYSRIRQFVKLKNRFGLPGLAILTPAILSIPIGCIITAKLFHNKKQVIWWMALSSLMWSLTLSIICLVLE